MSTGKRLAKRSILGTRVVAPGSDGRFYPAVIQAVKTYEDRLSENKYTVRFESSRKVSEFRETEIIGAGFGGVLGVRALRSGQTVYLTHQGREMEGTVAQHKPGSDSVQVNLASGVQLEVRLEDIRLLESRRSSRLMGQGNTDFSKLADFNIVHERKRLNSEKSNSDGSECYSSRKRRGSETLSEEGSSGDEAYRAPARRGRRRLGDQGRRKEESPRRRHAGHHSPLVGGKLYDSPRRRGEEVRAPSSPIMTECTAAMVLMDLSGTPAGRVSHASGHSDVSSASSGQMSPSSSGVSSLGTSWSCSSPSPSLTPPFPLPQADDEDEELRYEQMEEQTTDPVEALLQLSSARDLEKSDTDEGIVSDQSNDFEENNKRLKTEHVRTIYQCTWPGCDQQEDLCTLMEQHVRRAHLGREDPPSPEEDDHEEEFYYTEIDIPMSLTVVNDKLDCDGGGSLVITEQAGKGGQAPVLADHMDMARPPHENPEYGGSRPLLPAPSPTYATIIGPAPLAGQSLHAVPIAIPITTFTIATSQSSGGKYIRLSPKPYGSSPKSPIRRPRGDAKKCRKVYGMEHRELWCTQCKWKKACTRFGDGV